jgi:phosphoribosyl 1,2-cyclic phosphate phosphodiesterase
VNLKITVLGSGTSQGVPVIGCPCEVCASSDLRDKRLRSSILVEKGNTTIVVDTGPDFRQQMLQYNVKKLDAVLITHCHKDHIAGMDDIRSYNYLQQKAMDVYARPEDQEAIKHEFYYAFGENPYPGVPRFNLLDLGTKPLQVGDLHIIPFEVMHMHLTVLGFRFGDFSYITDANYISPHSLEIIRGSKVIILDALRRKKHVSHFNLDEAIDVVRQLKPEKAYFTHVSHLMGKYADVQSELPENMFLAYDGLQLTL